ncbi:orotidine-5'-phosphate decarboxylase [Piptocephalis cylindrospora]|uniref:Orotidine 5'-phosphate decarboxylase n=1 Tax=Piptocephalis cylindrospora TaxID=1907219 RepID=A0A4V1IY38_9FUNG|nr:orotidine-5'-phosphate decarboxylase [Piptocephalis cylindrospora]|eukprot:RKP13209.1 orotidine-5'-phosphate decarboxylase [Piptocephalis cylindrospora]
MPRPSYGERAKNQKNPLAQGFLELMERKQSNLSVAADVSSKAELLELANVLGPYICLFKTHIDIVEDFDQDLVDQLTALAKKHDFFIFEDRKFADIGNTVRLQYEKGVYHIADWAHITNAHPIPGPGIITGLASAGVPRGRGLLLLAEMSSAGSLATGTYTQSTIDMALAHPEFVIGFVASRRLTDQADFLYMSPGIGLDVKGDGHGQQYRTPAQAIEGGSDVVIVGRGIYGPGKDRVAEAKRYREASWAAYLTSLE